MSPKDLSALSICDTRCARAFLGSEDDCAYVPYELNVLDGLGELQQDLKLRLEAEQREHAVDLQLFAHLKEETAVGRLIATFSSKTILERWKASSWHQSRQLLQVSAHEPPTCPFTVMLAVPRWMKASNPLELG